MLLASEKLDLRNELDQTMFNHISYVSNQILLMMKREGVTGDVLEKSGKLLWRLFNVMLAYNAKRRDVTLEAIANIVLEFRSVFNG